MDNQDGVKKGASYDSPTRPERILHRSAVRNAMTPRITIMVVNWNGMKFLADCLQSLSRQTYADREIILVDNASTDSSVSFVAGNFPGVKNIRLDENRGFTGGNAEGFKIAEGQFIALVNNDTRLHEQWLENLLQPMLQNPDVGICASRILFDNQQRINSEGDGLTTAGVGCSHGFGKDPALISEGRFVFGACGAAALYRRQMLDEIGFLDEDFYLYDEDTDLNFRAQLAGWKCAYVPSALVHHRGNATSVRLSDMHVYYHSRNLEWVWLKNMPTGLMLRFAHHKIIQEIGSFCYICLRHGKWAPFFRAKRDALRKAPAMWRKRKAIQLRKRVPNYYIRALLSSIFTVNFLRQKLKQLVAG